jgi:hypothetical protein
MITNMRIETTDEERRLLAVYFERNSVTKRLATRKEITELINQLLSDIMTKAHQGEYDECNKDDNPAPEPAGHRDDSGDAGRAGDKGFHNVRHASNGFKPSRGDEPYLYKGMHPALTEKCGAMLDIAEQIDQLIWEALEANRGK